MLPENLNSIQIVPPLGLIGNVSVDPLKAVEVIGEALTQVEEELTEFLASPAFATDLQRVFGQSTDVPEARTLIDALSVRDEFPQITLVSADLLKGAVGGFDALTGTVYLADSLIAPNSLITSETKPSPNLVNVLTEELGHYIDSKLHLTDTRGDEGELFAALVCGEVLSWQEVRRLRQEDDRVRILGGLIEVEANSNLVPGVISDTIDKLFERDKFTFKGQKGDVINLGLSSEIYNGAKLSLLNPDGSELTSLFNSSSYGFEETGDLTLTKTGTYTVIVEANDFGTGEYTLAWDKMQSKSATPISGVKGTLTGTIDFSIDQDNFTFKGKKGDVIDLALWNATSNSVTLQLLDPDGSELTSFSSYYSLRQSGDLTLTKTGTYTVIVDGDGSSTGDYTLGWIGLSDLGSTPKLSISGRNNIAEGNKGNKNARFTVSLDNPSTETVTVNYATTNGTAKVGEDYRRTQGKLSFKPGETRKTINVPVFGDTKVEPDQTFKVILSQPKNAKLGQKQAIGTIINDDSDTDSFETAVNLGKLTEEIIRVDQIGFTEGDSRDTDDYYRFQLARKGTLVLTLDGLFKDANIDLYGDEKELISQSNNQGISSENLKIRLDAGTYYVRVYPKSNTRTEYRLGVDLI